MPQLVYVEKGVGETTEKVWLDFSWLKREQVPQRAERPQGFKYEIWPNGWAMSLMKVSDLELLATQNEGYPLDGDKRDIFDPNQIYQHSFTEVYLDIAS